jgi:methanogenic corrinoid protein MtbC1
MSGSAPSSSSWIAELLEHGAPSFAGFAANIMLEDEPELERRYAPGAHALWRDHLRERVYELSAAVATGESGLFVARIAWAREGFVARGQSQSDLDRALDALRRVLEEHLPEKARRLPLDLIDQGRSVLAAQEPMRPTPRLDPADPDSRAALDYLRRVLEGEPRAAIDGVLALVDGERSALDVYVDVLLSAQREIGRLWHLGEVNVAEEHLVTATTQRAVAVLVHSAPSTAPNGRTVVAAAVAGDDHDIGLRAVSDAFELSGWRTLFLGRNMPGRDLVQALEFFDADLLLLTATLSTQLSRVRQAIASIREHPELGTRILVGGSVFDEAPDLWERVGADAHAPDIRSALSVGARLVGLAE